MKLPAFSNLTGSLRQIGNKPLLAAGVGAGLVAVPFFGKNDDRGYFGTAAITTPLILGASLAGVQVYNGYQSSKSQIHALFAAKIFSPDPINPPPGAVAAAAGDINGSVWETERIASAFYAHNASEPFDFARHGQQISSAFYGELNKETGLLEGGLWNAKGKESQLANAFHNARLSSMSTDEAARQPIQKTLPTLEEMVAMLGNESLMTNENFVKTLNSNLTQTRKNWDSGGSILGSKSGAWRTPMPHALIPGTSAWETLAAQRPEVAAALTGSNLKEFKRVQIISDDVVSGKIGRVLSVSFYKEGVRNPFVINIIDPVTGKARMGTNYATEGVGRYIYNQNGAVAGDVFLAQHIHEDWAKLEVDKKRAFYFGAIDPMDDDMSMSDLNLIGMDDVAIKLRSGSAVPTSLAEFAPEKPRNGKDLISFAELNGREREALVEHLMQHGLNKVSSEGSFGSGVMDVAGMELLHVGGIIDPTKQMTEFRSHAKPYHLASSDSYTHFGESLNPFVSTNAYKEFFGETASEVGVRVGAVTSDVKTLLGDLPSTVAELDNPLVAKNFMRHLREHQKLSEMDAQRVWDSMKVHLSDQANLEGARSLGHLGEGGFLAKRGMKGLDLEGSRTLYVTEARINAETFDHFTTNSFGKNQLLGFTQEGEQVTASGDRNFIKSWKQMGDGRIAIQVSQHYDFKTGIKLDVNGIKGLAYTVDDDTFDRALSMVNQLTENIAGGGFGHQNFQVNASVDMLAVSHYMHDKSDPVAGIFGAAGDSLRRIETISNTGQYANTAPPVRPTPFTEVSDIYLAGMKSSGFSWVDGSLQEDMNFVRKLSDEQKRARIQSLVELTEGFMDEVGRTVRDNGAYGDSLFMEYRRANDLYRRTATGKKLAKDPINLMNYITHVAMPATLRAWSTTSVDLPRKTKLTYDMANTLYRNNYHGALGDIQGRVTYPQGNPAEARSLMEHVLDGDFSRPLGNAVALSGNEISSAFPNGTHNLGLASVRQGSIFDSSNPEFNANYSLDLGEGAKRRFVPVLGHESFKGGTNKFEFDKESQTTLEKAIVRIQRASGDAQDAAVDDYFNTLRHEMFGKNGINRADAIDPLGHAGFIQTAPSSLRNADGSVNPFQVSISEEMAHNLKDHKLKKSLFAQLNGEGEDVYAALTRHPVSAMPFVNVRIDKNLKGSNIMGIDESARQLIHSDDDKDTGWLYFMTHGSAGEAEAQAAIKEGSRQHEALALNRALFGISDDARRVTNTTPKSLVERLFDPVKGLLGRDADKVAIMRSRTTSAAIGEFSNTLTRMMLQIGQNPELRRSEPNKLLLSDALWAMRQAPIDAAKAGNGKGLEWAHNLNERISHSLNKRDAAGLERSLGQLFESQGSTPWIKEMESLGLTQAMADAKGEIKPLQTFWKLNGNGGRISQQFVSGMSEDVDKLSRLLTASKLSLENPQVLQSMDQAMRAWGDHLPEVQGASRGGSRMAQESASVLGEFNSNIRNAAGVVHEKFKDVKNALKGNMGFEGAAQMVGLGLGVAALAGIASARPSFGKRTSANKVRPEDAAGAQDHIPGEPIAGSRSPAQMPRISHAAAPPRSSYVTPVQQQRSIDVQVKGDNQQDSVERAKMLARMSGNGNSNVTVVNRDQTNLRSLRFQSKMREQRDK